MVEKLLAVEHEHVEVCMESLPTKVQEGQGIHENG